jgi:hypothetical protein
LVLGIHHHNIDISKLLRANRINAAAALVAAILRCVWVLMINLDTIIGIVLGAPLGSLIGYRWRDRISQRRRDHYVAERTERERRAMMERERKASIGDSTN